MQDGLVQVYTGNGKGKTTAALGLALRALGHNWRVVVLQFMKSGANCGEIKALHRFPDCQVYQFGREVLVDMNNPDPLDRVLAEQGLTAARQVVREDRCDLLILDEINVALACKLVKEEEVKILLSERPRHMEMVLTGRYAPLWLIEMADLVTEMRQIKHPFEQGIVAREGIEY